MTSGGDNFNDIPKLYRPEKSQPKYREDLFLVRGRGPIS